MTERELATWWNGWWTLDRVITYLFDHEHKALDMDAVRVVMNARAELADRRQHGN